MAMNGKSKGNTFERKIANTLSARFADILGMTSGFRRNPDSGSFFGGANKKRVGTHSTELASFGDLICPSGFLFSVECKHYKTPPTFKSLVTQTNTIWDKWISQATQDSINSNRQMMLIVKYNGVEELVFVETRNSSAFVGITPRLVYKHLTAYTLDDFLKLPDSTFFAPTV